MFTTTQEYFKTMADTFATAPTTPEAIKETLEKSRRVIETEVATVKDVITVCNKSLKGDATANELNGVVKKMQSTAVAMRFAAFMSVPGAVFALPAMMKLADEYKFEFVPESVKTEFDI